MFVAERELICLGRLEIRVENRLAVVEGIEGLPRPIEGIGDLVEKDRGTGRRRLPVAGDVAVVELAVEASQHAVLPDLIGEADPRREMAPLDGVVDAGNDLSGLVPKPVEPRIGRNIRGDLIKAHSDVDGQFVVDAPRVIDVGRDRLVLSAVGIGVGRHPVEVLVVVRVNGAIVIVVVGVHVTVMVAAVDTAGDGRFSRTRGVGNAKLELVIAAEKVVSIGRDGHVDGILAVVPAPREIESAAVTFRAAARRRVIDEGSSRLPVRDSWMSMPS